MIVNRNQKNMKYFKEYPLDLTLFHPSQHRELEYKDTLYIEFDHKNREER
jgi:hypothetical protein